MFPLWGVPAASGMDQARGMSKLSELSAVRQPMQLFAHRCKLRNVQVWGKAGGIMQCSFAGEW